ncbi:hypothetical protein F9C07_2917 [Aspergillus flavus]|uniref:Uncharacterized protein n=1 Tax=Aspergillus flavus (strain ATCC 200026 / FGSC A1120 / IAM 13836 / NRRL 3357 / JCM 12722 / SRRC 167) TaxID=332952 RepID=A0A7U2MEE3_ASPFN|nr:hypothetical protein F9C07_2917 [Aspergillus flavus]
MGYGAGTDSWPEDNRTDWSLESIYQLLVYSTMYYKDWSNRFPMRLEEILRKKKDPMKTMGVQGREMVTGFKGKIYDPPQCGLDSRIRNA